MPLNITWQLDPQTGGAFNAFAPRSIRQAQALTYSTKAKDADVAESLTPIQLSDQDALETDPFPAGVFDLNEPARINETLFTWNDTTKDSSREWYFCPWLIASSKRVERDRGDKTIFRCVVEYSTGSRQSLSESKLSPVSVPYTLIEYPFIVENIWGEEDKVIYDEAYAGQPESLQMRLPTGNLYSEPFKRRHPIRSIRQHQFETIADGVDAVNSLIENRLFTTNDRAFKGDPVPDLDPNDALGNVPRWMITDVQYQPVLAPIKNTPATDPPLLLEDTYLMTYTIERTSRDGGWYDRRALVDTHFLRTANILGSKEAYRDPTDGATIIPCLIKADGTRKDPQTGNPDYLNYVVQPKGDWEFLRQ